MNEEVFLVTGAAGFIGYHLSKRLLEEGSVVIGLDNLNKYYDPELKKSRLSNLKKYKKFNFEKVDIKYKNEVDGIFEKYNPDIVINLAAQAGVRYSIENPQAYVDSNLIGFMNVLEACRNIKVKHLLYASSSSVYGGNSKTPFSTLDNVDHPVSLYAATKKSNELLAHSYSHLYGIPTTGMRFFTVYGPYGRPDMAYFSFTEKIINNKTIQIFNKGEMKRDFTYIDDVIESIMRLINKIPQKNKGWSNDDVRTSFAPYRVINIGNNNPKTLIDFISIIESTINKKAKKEYLGMQNGDVKETYADISDLNSLINYLPKTKLEDGIQYFVDWYKEYYM